MKKSLQKRSTLLFSLIERITLTSEDEETGCKSNELVLVVIDVHSRAPVCTPVFNAYFFTMQSLVSCASVRETLVRLQLALPTSIVNSVKVWSGVAFVSFLWVGEISFDEGSERKRGILPCLP